MSISSPSRVANGAAFPPSLIAPKRASSAPDTNGTLTQAATETPDPDREPRLIDRIRDMGFAAYAEEIKQEKLEDMRKEILRAMGLTEEDLSKMSPDQRENIERMIAQEIARRLAAQSETEKKPKGLMPGIPATLIAEDATTRGGLGVLLALQERDMPADPREPASNQSKNDD